MCQHCVKHATEALEKIDGVSDVKVSLEDKNAVIHVNQNVTDEQITNAIVEAGYEVTAIK
ncbi:Copper chaperone [Megamonas hypermegale ART12/1]|nr:Copper chaperone [Megamonas hypermegale ART12/1]